VGLGDERYVGSAHLLMVDDDERALIRHMVRDQANRRGVSSLGLRVRDILLTIAALVVAVAAVASLLIQLYR